MKKSILREVIKSEIKSLLLEGQMTSDEAFKILRTAQREFSTNLSVSQGELIGQALDTLQAAEVSRMMDREPSFKGTGERAGFDMRGIDESLNPEVSKSLDSFITSMAKRYGYEEQDAVYAIMAALEQRKSDTKYEMPGFKGTRDALDTISIREEEIDDYEIGDQVVVANNFTTDPLNKQGEMGVVTKVDIEHEIVEVTFKDRKTGRYYPGAVIFPGSPGRDEVRESEEMDDAAMDKAAAKSAKKGDSITATSNKLQKLVKQMKSKAKEFKAAEGDAKEKIKDELKKMTKEKKQLEKAL